MDRPDQEYQALIGENADLKRKIKELEKFRAERQKMDDALLESEATYRMIAENTADIIRILDMDLRSTYISPSVLRIRGLTVEEASKQTLSEIFSPESLKHLRDFFKEELKLEATGTADPNRFRTVEAEVYKKDGSLIWMEIVFSFLRNRNGKLIGILTVSRDITKRKAAEAALRESEEKFRALVENSRDMIMRFDQNHRYLYVNPAIAELSGIPAGQFPGKTDEELGFPKNICPGWHEELEQSFRSGQVHRLEFLHPDGRWIDWMFMPEGDSSGQVTAVITSARDITEPKKNEALLSSLFQAAPLAVYVADGDRLLIKVNDYAYEIFGYPPEEMLGRNSRFLFFCDEDYTEAGKTIYSSNTATKEFRMRKKNGEEIWALINRSYLNGRDASAGFIVIVQDITARKALEDQLRQVQKMEAIGQLAGGIAHDFNNILQAILGYTQMLMLSLAPEDKNRATLREVEKAGEKAAVLTRQLLAFSRRQVLQLGPLDLNRTIEDLMKMLHRLIGENIDLKILPSQDLWTVHADAGQMQQVIINLCVNARDAMPKGGRLSIETRNVQFDDDFCTGHEWARPGRYVQLSIVDSGCGMDQETKSRIFEPFFTTKEEGHGTGLGLATVYGIVRQHDGMIHVASKIGEGSEFSIYLPITERTEEGILADTQEPVPGGHETILLAEDDEPLRFLATEILKLAGYRVLAAVDGEDAVRLYREHEKEVDLLLMDVVMPQKSGFVVLDELRTTRPDIRCLFMTGYSQNARQTDLILKQGYHLIRKPFNSTDLLRIVRKELDRS